NSCAPIWALDVATNAASPNSRAPGFANFIMTSFSNSAGCPRYSQGRCVAVSGTRARMDHAAAAPEIADHARKGRIGHSNSGPADAMDPWGPEHSGRCYRSSSQLRVARTGRSRMDWAPRCNSRANRRRPERLVDIAYP